MTVAPSEKHLEDWIVANPQRFARYEDRTPDYTFPEDNPRPFLDCVVDRQLKLPHGIADLIGRHQESIFVVELKKGAITSEVVAQTCRYMYDLGHVFSYAFDRYVVMNPEGRDEFDYETEHPSITWWRSEIRGLIVGHGISDPNLLVACGAANIDVAIYDFQDGEYEFYRTRARGLIMSEQCASIAAGKVGEAMGEIMRYRANQQRQRIALMEAANRER